MPRYFFDTLDGTDTIDDEGEDLADHEAAKVVAAQIISELTPTRTAHIWAGAPFKVVVRDSDNAVIGYLTVSATLAGL